MPKAFLPNFSYLSQILNLPVLNNGNNKKLGRIDDLVIDLKEMYPRIVALVIRKNKSSFRVPWSCVKFVTESKSVKIDDYATYKNIPVSTASNELFLKKIFWDKQIVDTDGSKVVRVNDLHLLREKMSYWVIHVDIGIKGLLRRLGWVKFFDKLIKWLFGYEIKEKFISWKNVHPIVESEQFKSLSINIPQSKLYELHPADLADILADLGTEERINIFMSLDLEASAKTFQELPLKIKLQITDILEVETLGRILTEMPMDEAVDFMAELKPGLRNALYKVMPSSDVMQIKDLLTHSNRTAGSLMNVEFITVNKGINVADVLDVIKHEAEEYEAIYYIYVVDEDEKIIGIVSLKQLLTAKPDTLVSDIMRTKVISVEVHTHINSVAKIFFKYDFSVVPVVDEDDKIVGIITIKDALKAVFPEIREESEEI